jgi:GNAT superfamily N-acetyltransferase
MVSELAHVTLKSGEAMRVLKVAAPQPDWIDRILPFLGHKGESWLAPMREAYESGLDDLALSDFVGVVADGTLVGNITTVEHRGVAVLQHVFTPPEQRRKGIASALLQGLCDDFRARNGRAVYLSTGYDTPPFHIYESFGFVGRGDSGKMTWVVAEGFAEKHFAPGPATIRGTRWSDWPLLEALYAVSGQWQLKGYLFQQFGHAAYEGEYVQLRRRMEEGSILDVKVMEGQAGAVVGHALVAVQPQWKKRALVLDCMVHRAYWDQTAELLKAVAIPEGARVQAFCDTGAEAKIDALKSIGFAEEGYFKGQIEDENHRATDVVVLGRGG